jgi:hypothetical protein
MPERPYMWTVTYRRRYHDEDNYIRYDYDEPEYFFSQERAGRRKNEMDLMAWLREPTEKAFQRLAHVTREGSGCTKQDVDTLRDTHRRCGKSHHLDKTKMAAAGGIRTILEEIYTAAVGLILTMLCEDGNGGEFTPIELEERDVRDFLVTNAAHMTEEMVLEAFALAAHEETLT